MALRYLQISLTLLATSILFGFAAFQDKDEDGFVPLFNGQDLSGFKFMLDGKQQNETTGTFTVKDGILEVSGKPHGHIHTEKSYKNFVLRFDWKFPKNGDTGCFVYMKNPKMLLSPTQVEGLERSHGNIMGATHVSTDREAQKKAIKIGEWNTTEIISKDGEVTSKVNGIQISTGKCEKASEGLIGFQSSGSQVFFKNIRIKETE